MLHVAREPSDVAHGGREAVGAQHLLGVGHAAVGVQHQETQAAVLPLLDAYNAAAVSWRARRAHHEGKGAKPKARRTGIICLYL